MKIIGIVHDRYNMAVRFLVQELRLKKPGSNILVIKPGQHTIVNLDKVDYVFMTEIINQEDKDYILSHGGTIYTIDLDVDSVNKYHAKVMAILSEILL